MQRIKIFQINMILNISILIKIIVINIPSDQRQTIFERKYSVQK